MEKRNDQLEVATLGGGCFWCLEAVYMEVEGIEQVVSGYSGGSVPGPSYEQVCTGTTGHAEVVQVTFDPMILTYQEILEIFFSIHDPTTLNRQGADVGTQYRSVIFYRKEQQKNVAKQIIRDLETDQVFGASIVTEIAPLERFYAAEEYHQQYFLKNPGQGYCRAIIAPKLAKFRQKFASRLKG